MFARAYKVKFFVMLSANLLLLLLLLHYSCQKSLAPKQFNATLTYATEETTPLSKPPRNGKTM